MLHDWLHFSVKPVTIKWKQRKALMHGKEKVGILSWWVFQLPVLNINLQSLLAFNFSLLQVLLKPLLAQWPSKRCAQTHTKSWNKQKQPLSHNCSSYETITQKNTVIIDFDMKDLLPFSPVLFPEGYLTIVTI